jgi:hypothetical protein
MQSIIDQNVNMQFMTVLTDTCVTLIKNENPVCV